MIKRYILLIIITILATGCQNFRINGELEEGIRGDKDNFVIKSTASETIYLRSRVSNTYSYSGAESPCLPKHSETSLEVSF